MKKRITAGLLAIVMLLISTMTGMVFMPNAAKAAGSGVTVIIHYGGREDDNYEIWNLWLWEDGADGKQVDFTSEDDFGKIAIYQTTNTPEKIGFIVRAGEWEEKDVDADRFIEINGNTAEIWVTSGKEEFETKAPKGAKSYDFAAAEKKRMEIYNKKDALKINVHYYSFNGGYKDISAYSWPGDQAGGSYPVVEKDDFGGVYHIGYTDLKDIQTAGLTFYLANGQEDVQTKREIDLTKAKNNVLDVYTVQGNSEVWYTKEEADKTPQIVTAAFTEKTSKEIAFSLSKPIDTSNEKEAEKFKVTDQDGIEYEIVKIWTETPGVETDAVLIMKEPLDLSKTYTLAKDGYNSQIISIGTVFSSKEFEEAFHYEGDDLGAVYTDEKTSFRVWAPTASEVMLNLYEEGSGDNLIQAVNMAKDVNGTWVYEAKGDLNGTYYTYSVTVDGKTKEAVDLYARSTGVNGERGMILDLDSTNPSGFSGEKRPAFVNPTDAVIYELHVRDLSSDKSSGIQNVGKFLEFTERDTTNSNGTATGLDHLIDLGVTHVQILPSFDYATVDESKADNNQFNWGYDPKNYNTPEGSYSTNAEDGAVRVNEYKQMVQSLHKNNIRVIMDVVYNHTFDTEESNFQKIVPNYYYRKNGEAFSNASGCGNETASERSMVRKYIVDSVVYWATEYHVDGFRFDLMGIHDIETMNAIREALDKVDPSILVYGEGWTGGDSVLEEDERAVKKNMDAIEGIAAFSDDIRDGMKGNVFDANDTGFVSGKEGMEETIKYAAAGAVEHEQVDITKNEKSDLFWAKEPTQVINYASCHDNLTLWDKLAVSNGDDSVEDRIKMNKLCSAIVFTSQGIPFLQAGEELLRSKPYVTEISAFSDNSYNLPDTVNSIKWDDKDENIEVYDYYKGLIAFRKSHNALRMTTAEEIQKNLRFISDLPANVVGYTIENSPNGEVAERLMVIYNANKDAINVTLPEGSWNIYVNGETAGCNVLEKVEGSVSVEGISAMVLAKEDKKSENYKAEKPVQGNNMGITEKVLAIMGVVLFVGLVTGLMISKKKGNKK